MTALLLGAALGLVAGAVPGPFFTLVATTAVRNGFRAGTRMAMVPFGTELPALFVAVFVLTRLPDEGLRWMGVVGGTLLVAAGWRVAKNDEDPSEEDDDASIGLKQAWGLGLVSPTPWVFWFLLGGPITVNRWHEGPHHAVLFVAGFLVLFVGTLVGVAGAGASTGRKLGATSSRWFFRGAGAALAIAGALIAWQSWVGNFSDMVRAPERIEAEIGARRAPGTGFPVVGTFSGPRPSNPGSSR